MEFGDIRIVLVEPTHPGNIGASARAMKNMGLDRLHLVRPRRFPHAEATARASGADDVLARARVHETLEEAIADCALVIGASARRRSIAWPEYLPEEAAAKAREVSQRGASVAILFGREHSGLTNAELDRCHALLHIPTNPDYPSLNLGAAVQVVSYELRLAHLAGTRDGEGGESLPPAPAAAMEAFYDHLETTLVEIGFLDPDNPKQAMRRLRRLFNRAAPDEQELNLLRGILSAAQGAKWRRLLDREGR